MPATLDPAALTVIRRHLRKRHCGTYARASARTALQMGYYLKGRRPLFRTAPVFA